MKTSRRCKTTVLHPVALLCIGLLTLNLWLTKTTLVHSSDDEDKPPTSASTSTSAGFWSAKGKVDASFSGEAELYEVGKKWEGHGRAEAGLGKWYQPTNSSNVDEGAIFVKIKVMTSTHTVTVGNTASVNLNYAHIRDRSKMAWGMNFDKFANARGSWEGSQLSSASASWVNDPPNSYY